MKDQALCLVLSMISNIKPEHNKMLAAIYAYSRSTFIPWTTLYTKAPK